MCCWRRCYPVARPWASSAGSAVAVTRPAVAAVAAVTAVAAVAVGLWPVVVGGASGPGAASPWR